MSKRLLALLVCTLALAACSTTVQHSTPEPLPSFEPQVRVGEDDAGAPIVEPLPEEVRYQSESFDDPQLAVIYRDHFRTSVEGGDAMFLEAIAADGTVTMDERLDLDGRVRRLPAGGFVLTAYLRGCGMDACTQYLGERVDICSADVRLKERLEYSLAISQERGRCDFAEVK